MSSPLLSEADPEATWSALASDRRAILFDVRTSAEWSFVGVPDLSEIGAAAVFIEWQRFPTMETNPGFLAAALDAIGTADAEEAYFICRSGARSMHAAAAVADATSAQGRELRCVNVATGFEGDLDEAGHRGRKNGWKAAGLPWRQG